MTEHINPLSGTDLPHIKTAIPGPQSMAMIDDLADVECPAITARRARRAAETGLPQDPIVWSRAHGANVEDVDGNIYVDLTSAFAVAGLGHTHPEIVEAAQTQSAQLIHAMGDVYPSSAKIKLSRALAQIAPEGLSQSILGLSGASAIEAALKTATIHTGKPGVIAFWGGYHGLSHGALAATAYRSNFRQPFLSQLNPFIHHVPYPDSYRPPFGMPLDHTPDRVSDAVLAHIRAMLTGPATGAEDIGAILIEPIQGRGGEIEPPPGFLHGLRALCDEFGLVLIFDEIYTGFARTGDMFACQHDGVLPDILCVGKALGGGFPISAAIGKADVMRSWGNSSGEAIHTSTFLGNPMGCAMATASIHVLQRDRWDRVIKRRGDELIGKLQKLQDRYSDVIGKVRGRGFMLGLELVQDRTSRTPHSTLALGLMDYCRQRGYLVLPSGTQGHVLALSPPFTITDEQLDGFLDVLDQGFSSMV